MKKHFSTDVEKEIFIAQMVEAGEITKAQAYDALCEMKNLNKKSFIPSCEIFLQLTVT